MASRKPLVNISGALSEVPSGDSLTVAGIVESTSGGIKFPDASIQTTAYTGGGSTVVTGNSTLDFGAYPGSNEASIAVTGQTSILSTSRVSLYILADDTTSDHSANDHKYLQLFCVLSAGTPTTATGFTIYARSLEKLQGTWKVRWMWTT